MRILVLSQYFWPESFIINDFVKNLMEQGHEVTVATGKPNYPAGKIFEGYTEKNLMTEKFLDQVDVIRIPLRARQSGGTKNLILNYLSFVWNGLFYFPKALGQRKFDHILVFAPSPIVQAIPAILLKYKLKARLSIWVQDLWPESLAATGFIKNPILLFIVGLLVRFIYFFSDVLLVQSRAFIEPVAKYADRKKIVYYPNSFDLMSMKENPQTKLPTELDEMLTKNFSLVFAGNLGTAQSLETITAAAEKLRDLKSLKLIIVGNGSQLEWLEAEIKSKALTNIYLAGRFPMESMPTIYAKAKALLVTLKDDPVFHVTIPSKVQAYLASGKPIIAAVNGEAARVLEEAQAGFVGASEQADLLARHIREAQQMPSQDLQAMGQNGRRYFNQNFEMSHQVKTLVELLQNKEKLLKGVV